MTKKGPIKTVAVVVPSLAKGGGVPTVARFVVVAAVASERWLPKLVSLSMSSSDPTSVSLHRPQTWWRGVSQQNGTWHGFPYVHVGALGGELEFQRYARRAVLDGVRQFDEMEDEYLRERKADLEQVVERVLRT